MIDRVNTTVSFLVYGRYALFTDPVTKTGGERHTYPVPTYEVLRGILDNCYWKPTIRWIIDRVRIMNPITKESVGRLLPNYHKPGGDRSYHTYLRDVAYQVEAHFEWATYNEGFEQDRWAEKHLKMARRYIDRGGRHDIFLGSRECQGYVETCVFGEGEGAYDHQPDTYFGLMFHGYNYPNYTGRNVLEARLWHAEMCNGIITFPHPTECPIVRFIRPMEPKKWAPKSEEKDESIPPEVEPHTVGAPDILKKQERAPAVTDYNTWEAKLSETYDTLLASKLINGDENGVLPIGHKNIHAQIQIDIDGEGNYIPGSAAVIPKNNARTMIPCSDASINRTGTGKNPYLLFDELRYMAGDYVRYGGRVMDHGYEEYISQLNKWCLSKAEHPLARTVYDYVRKGTLIQDLVQDGLIPLDTDSEGNFVVPIKWEGEGPEPEIYSVCHRDKGPLSCSVRIQIMLEGLDPEIWKEPTLQESAIAFNELLRSKENVTDICYVSGREAAPAKIHPYAIGTSKLISSNDTTGFTYRWGILDKPEDRCQISYSESQKIHLAFRWLRDHQSFTIGPYTYLLWSSKRITLSELEIFFDGNTDIPEETNGGGKFDFIDFTGAEHLKSVRDFIRGYTNDLDPDEEIILMSIALPSPGRASILQYEPMKASSFHHNLLTWKETCYGFLPVEGGFALRSPSVNEIAHLAAGLKMGAPIGNSVSADNAKRTVLNTMVLGHHLPSSLIQSVYKNCVRNMAHPEVKRNPLFDRSFNVAAAVINYTLKTSGQASEKEWDRSYRFGQILAYMHEIENLSYFITHRAARITNAEKLIVPYCSTPARTFALLEKRLIPYIETIQYTSKGKEMLHSLSCLISDLSAEELTNSPLNEKFLIGYHSQLAALFQSIRERKNHIHE